MYDLCSFLQGVMGQGQMMSPMSQQTIAPSSHGAPSPALNQGKRSTTTLLAEYSVM